MMPKARPLLLFSLLFLAATGGVNTRAAAGLSADRAPAPPSARALAQAEESRSPVASGEAFGRATLAMRTGSSLAAAQAGNPAGENQRAFAQRKADWAANGTDLFAKAYRGEIVDEELRAMLEIFGNRSMRQANPVAMRILLQFPQALSDGYRRELTQYYQDRYYGQQWGSSHMWLGVSPNQMMNELAPMYLFSERNPEGVIHYQLDEGYRGAFPETFTYQGRTYRSGNDYNGLQFSRDLILWVYDNIYLNYDTWATGNDWSIESDNRSYTSAQLVATLLLRDLALDPTMAHRSDMAFQLLALNMLMDFSAKHWGGTVGDRDYVQYGVLENRSVSMAWSLSGDGNPGTEFWMDKAPFLSPKPFPELFLDLVRIVDEPDDYAHYNIEMNAAHDWDYVGDGETYPIENNSQKWTYVTKYYNLGGSRVQWQLALRTPQDWNRYGGSSYGPFRIWMNDFDDPVNASSPHQVVGKRNIQYKNALLILDREPLRFYDDLWNHPNAKEGYFFRDQTAAWDLYGFKTGQEIGAEREVWVAVAKNSGALEVCIVGVDHPSLAAFKQALATTAQVGEDFFVTSKGDRISTDGYWNYGLINGQPIWGEYGHPIPHFPLITTYDNQGNRIIRWDWETKTLTLSLKGQTAIYDYAQWTTRGPSGYALEDLNLDGTVDRADLTLSVDVLTGAQQDATIVARADVNGDGIVDARDVQQVANAAARH